MNGRLFIRTALLLIAAQMFAGAAVFHADWGNTSTLKYASSSTNRPAVPVTGTRLVASHGEPQQLIGSPKAALQTAIQFQSGTVTGRIDLTVLQTPPIRDVDQSAGCMSAPQLLHAPLRI